MCLRQIIKSSNLFALFCCVTLLIWLCIIKIHNMHEVDHISMLPGKGHKTSKSPKILTYVDDIRHQYPGPFHRYRRISGRWKRIRDDISRDHRYKHKIPHIIHQTWDTDNIPQRFVPWVVSWVNRHPKWEYWFWTPDDVKGLIRKNYPKSEKLFKSYKQALLRADVMRYFVLHSFGGVYADLDTQSLKPLDTLLEQYSCFISEETHEHSHLLYFRNPPNIMTTIMACKPEHPLFLVAIRALPFTQARYPNDVLKSTGPLFLDSVYRHYLDQSSEFRSIKILPPEYLLPTYDVSQSYSFERVCLDLRENSPKYLKKTCDNWNSGRRVHNTPTSNSFTNHYWVHVALQEKRWKKMKSMEIEQALNMKPRPMKNNETFVLEASTPGFRS